MQSTRDQVFISYSHSDKEWLLKLLTILNPLVRSDSIKPWSDESIAPGRDWKKEIDTALASAKVAVLLVTHHFLASDFIMDYELPYLLDAQKDGVTLVWIAVGPGLWKHTPLSKIQAANDPNRPLKSLDKDSEVLQELVRIAEKIVHLNKP
jgi:internalin A